MVMLQAKAFAWFVLLYSLTMLLQVRAGPRNITIDDTDPAFNYATSPAWDTVVWNRQSPQPLNGTNHGSPNPGAVVTFTFTGTAFYMFGYKWTDHGFRTIAVDGTRTVQCNGRQGEQGSRSLVFSRENMTNSQHTVVIENTGTQGQYVNIDYAIITQDDTVLTSTTSAASQPTMSVTTASAPSKPFPVAAVAGAAAGGVAFTLVALGIFILWKCKLRRRSRTLVSIQQLPPNHPQQYPTFSNVRSASSSGSYQTSISGATPRYPAQFPVQYAPGVPPLSATSLTPPVTPAGPGVVQLGYTPVQHNQYIHHQLEKDSSAANRRSVANPSSSQIAEEQSTMDAPPQYTVTP